MRRRMEFTQLDDTLYKVARACGKGGTARERKERGKPRRK